MSDQNRLDDQVAVVTGGGRGIGRETAFALARAGAAIVVTARTSSEIDDTARQIQAEGGKSIAVSADISDWAQVQRVVRLTEETFGPPDLVVANASVLTPAGMSWEVDPLEWERNISINLAGTFHTTRAFLPGMVARRKGKLIFVSSGAARNPVPGWGAYCASKAGVDHFAQNLAAELSEKDIPVEVYIFSPGIVDTPMQATIRQLDYERFPLVERFRKYKERNQLRSPQDPAQVIWWIAAGRAAELQGKVIVIDDPAVREQVSMDLGTPMLSDR